MPKSRQRKDHKKKAQAYKKRVKDAKNAFQNQMRTMFEKQQLEQMQSEQSVNQVQQEQIEGLDSSEFSLDDNFIDNLSEDIIVSEENK